jgi:hypothetical protein
MWDTISFPKGENLDHPDKPGDDYCSPGDDIYLRRVMTSFRYDVHQIKRKAPTTGGVGRAWKIRTYRLLYEDYPSIINLRLSSSRVSSNRTLLIVVA